MCYQSIVSARTQLPFSSSAIHFLLTSSAFFEAAPADGLIQSHHLRQVRVHGFRIDRCLRRGGCGCLVVDFKWVQQLYRYIECCRSWEAILTTAALVRPSCPFRTSCTIPSFHRPWQSLTNRYWYLRVAVTCASLRKCEHELLSSCLDTLFTTASKLIENMIQVLDLFDGMVSVESELAMAQVINII